ncbi:hypothetical protein EX895_005426 [Sporisorium graminicola]|uniref:Uncharacterized protein n=1 Tax=Sporisorium graminicola TaxID=280036 RepID=A0A4U7KN64_9BASI|nr:hypothetical protein EX895_005426 [Sporisorium graminicola]TKY85885.1 hypothetical protein EX895_005426 [Sporisorium graminicola]
MADEADQKLELHPHTVDKGSKSNGADAPSSSSAPSKATAAGPIPMWMPSILRNSGTTSQSNHLEHLLASSSSSYPPSAPRDTRSRASNKEPQLGRRKQRRSDNARLLSNPHAVRPTIKDYRLHSNEIRSTFPSAGGGKPHSVPVPSSSRVGYSEPVHDPTTANQGHFGKSLRDAQRVLKRLETGNIDDEMIRQDRAGDLERFIWLVDREIRGWAEGDVFVFATEQGRDRKAGTVLLDESFGFTTSPFEIEAQRKAQPLPTVDLDSIQPEAGGQLIEFQRTPNALVWLVHDPFLRLIVHCLARVSRCPSFSKDDPSRPGLRFTWILNRNPLARRSRRGRRVSVSSSNMSTSVVAVAAQSRRPAVIPRHLVGGSLETPPTTDFDSQTESELDTDTAVASELADSLVIVPPQAEEGEEAREQGVETDEEEADILRRVRRWAIDSHRQRAQESHQHAEEHGDAVAATVTEGIKGDSSAKPTKPKSKLKRARTKEQQDPDQTLTGTAIAEEGDEEAEDEGEGNLEDEVRPFSHA